MKKIIFIICFFLLATYFISASSSYNWVRSTGDSYSINSIRFYNLSGALIAYVTTDSDLYIKGNFADKANITEMNTNNAVQFFAKNGTKIGVLTDSGDMYIKSTFLTMMNSTEIIKYVQADSVRDDYGYMHMKFNRDGYIYIRNNIISNGDMNV